MTTEHTVNQSFKERWIPAEWHDLRWFNVEDLTAIAVGDKLFDPEGPYAGEVIDVRTIAGGERLIQVVWRKTEMDSFPAYHTGSYVQQQYWYADPLLQDEE
jgi:hypothetical protein